MASILKIMCQALRGGRGVKMNETSSLPSGSFTSGVGDRLLGREVKIQRCGADTEKRTKHCLTQRWFCPRGIKGGSVEEVALDLGVSWGFQTEGTTEGESGLLLEGKRSSD